MENKVTIQPYDSKEETLLKVSKLLEAIDVEHLITKDIVEERFVIEIIEVDSITVQVSGITAKDAFPFPEYIRIHMDDHTNGNTHLHDGARYLKVEDDVTINGYALRDKIVREGVGEWELVAEKDNITYYIDKDFNITEQ